MKARILLLALSLAALAGLTSCHAVHHAAHDIDNALFHGGGGYDGCHHQHYRGCY